VKTRDEKRAGMTRELIDLFQEEGFRILGACGVAGYPSPAPIHNDGYGDQQDKVPDALAYDDQKKCFVIGLVITGDESLESEELLTEYNVFLDQKDAVTGEPHHLYILLPPALTSDLTALLTHYIHREYWHKLVLVPSERHS